VKPPNSVVIGPYRYEVSVDEAAINAHSVNVQEECIGRVDRWDQTIVIRPGLGADVERESVLHELLHVVTRVVGLGQHDNEERFVTAMAPTLLDALRRNPRLVRYLTEKG
jgi:hypothetical protein